MTMRGKAERRVTKKKSEKDGWEKSSNDLNTSRGHCNEELGRSFASSDQCLEHSNQVEEDAVNEWKTGVFF